MARLSGRGKKEEGKEERKGRTGGQLGKRNLGLVRATGLSSRNGGREWSIRALLTQTLHLELDSGSGLRAGTTVRRREKFAAALCELVGQFRTRRAHKTVVDQPPWAEPLPQAQLPPDNIKTVAIDAGGHDRWGPALLKKLSRFRLALPGKLLELGDLTGKRSFGLGLVFAENFQPELMSQAMRLLFLGRGPWRCPHEAPT